MKSRSIGTILILTGLLISSCSLPQQANPTPTSSPTAQIVTESAATAAPVVASIQHKTSPGNSAPPLTGATYDSESASTASLKYAGNGDVYALNRFERPFLQDMSYLGYLDIQTFVMSMDKDWYYANIELYDLSGLASGAQPIYAAEIDYDIDGRGDFLIVAHPPFTTKWDTTNVSVYEDKNKDVGGPHPDQSDPSGQAGDGFETVLLSNGKGDDPDLAWARISQSDQNSVQIAFKKSLIPNGSFEWAAWADSGIKDPAKFNYNDRMSISDAGSPLKGDPSYSLKGLSEVDSTCYINFGTSETYKPLECPYTPPKAGPRPHPSTPVGATAPPPPPAGIVNPP